MQCRRPGFDPWIGKIPWRREWQPIPVPLPEKFLGQRSLEGYSPWGCKESDTAEQLTLWLHFRVGVLVGTEEMKYTEPAGKLLTTAGTRALSHHMDRSPELSLHRTTHAPTPSQSSAVGTRRPAAQAPGWLSRRFAESLSTRQNGRETRLG